MRNEKYGQTSSSYSRSRYNKANSKYTPTAFEHKIEQYKKNAEERKSQNRSGSAYGTGYSNDSRNYNSLRDKVKSLEMCYKNICLAFQNREEEFECLKEVIEDNENDRFSFIYQTDEALKMMQEMIHTEEESKSNSYGKGTQVMGKKDTPHSGSYLINDSLGRDLEGASKDSIKMLDLQKTNELLLKELRAANDKYFNKRQETKNYREEINALKEKIKEIQRENTANRSTSGKRNLIEVTQENETLMARIEKLKEECNALNNAIHNKFMK